MFVKESSAQVFIKHLLTSCSTQVYFERFLKISTYTQKYAVLSFNFGVFGEQCLVIAPFSRAVFSCQGKGKMYTYWLIGHKNYSVQNDSLVCHWNPNMARKKKMLAGSQVSVSNVS